MYSSPYCGFATHGSCVLRWSGEAVGLLAVESEVQGEHVHTRLAEQAEPATFRVLGHQLAHTLRIELAGLRHSRHLVEGGGGADVRIEPAAGGGDEIDGHRLGVA